MESGVVYPFESAAMANLEMPDGLPQEDQVLYIGLRFLYSSHKKGLISREVAVREKMKMADEYRLAKFRREQGERWVKIIKAIEGARSDYRKNPSKETADKMASALEGIL